MVGRWRGDMVGGKSKRRKEIGRGRASKRGREKRREVPLDEEPILRSLYKPTHEAREVSSLA